MASTLSKLLIHITFSTKARQPKIPAEIENDLYAYVGGICRKKSSALFDMGGTADHVHLLVNLGKTVALSTLMLEIKRESSRWMRQSHRDFQWQDGYFAFSIGESGSKALKRYIANQKTHHKRIDFKDEIRKLAHKYDEKLDERYAWD